MLSVRAGASPRESEQPKDNAPYTEAALRILLPVFISSADLQDQLDKNLTQSDGRFYPCPAGSDCYAKAGALYLEHVQVLVLAGRLAFTAHLGGKVSGPLFTHPDVKGEITVTGDPTVDNDVLHYTNLTFQTGSMNLITKLGADRLQHGIFTQLNRKAEYDIRQKLDSVRAQINANNPLSRISRCVGVQVTQLVLTSVTPVNHPDGVRVMFSAGVGLSHSPECESGIGASSRP